MRFAAFWIDCESRNSCGSLAPASRPRSRVGRASLNDSWLSPTFNEVRNVLTFQKGYISLWLKAVCSQDNIQKAKYFHLYFPTFHAFNQGRESVIFLHFTHFIKAGRVLTLMYKYVCVCTIPSPSIWKIHSRFAPTEPALQPKKKNPRNCQGSLSLQML